MIGEAATIRLSDSQLASFEENGFLAIDRLLDPEDIEPLEVKYDRLLDRVARQLHGAGKIPFRFEGLDFGERYARLLELAPDSHVFFNISLPLTNGAANAETFQMHSGPAVFALLRNEKILDLVESIVGPEIFSSPVQHMRMKPPEKKLAANNAIHSNVGTTVWHQDICAVLPEADDTEQLTVWVALSEATEENGCLASIPGSHRLGPLPHQSNALLPSEREVPGAALAGRRAVPLPVQRGGVVLFHKMNVHSALPNRSNAMRWSADLRYHPVGQATGRTAFPGFVARSRKNPAGELLDAAAWAGLWDEARQRILSGDYSGRLFEDAR